ncbi:hypothetical protein L6V77_18450 [Myxococcota bacterium]|nr:hypothetical protein [Myxococcota bacterium]
MGRPLRVVLSWTSPLVLVTGCLFNNESDDGNVGPEPVVGQVSDAGAGGTASLPIGGTGPSGGSATPSGGSVAPPVGGDDPPPAGGNDRPPVGGEAPPQGGERPPQGGDAPPQGGMSGGGGESAPPAAGSLGAPCERDADCDGGVCITDLPGGYCSSDCENTDCPEGGSCWQLGETAFRCLLNCADDGACRAGEGYVCDADDTCFPGGGGGPAGAGEVGGPCAADEDCGADGSCIPASDADGPTGFADGYCIQLGCSDASPCPAGSTCYDIGSDRTACLADCSGNADCRDGYACDPVGACLPACTDDSCPEGEICGDAGLCREPPCTPNSCPEGTLCGDDGYCQLDVGEPPPGPAPRCANLPSWTCDGNEALCGAVVAFDPREGDGYFCNHDEYRSFIRRDVMLMVKYASAAVECLTAGWAFGNGPPLGLGDMSERNGDIPGTSIGQPGHPEGTHVDGHDMDLAYYQINTRDNQLRPVCNHISGGEDQYHCISDPQTLDVWRSALFIGLLHHNPQLRVIGVDGRVGPSIMRALDGLCAEGYLDGPACDARQRAVTFEVENEGRGWFYFHHHHFHISFMDRRSAGLEAPLPGLRGPVNEMCITRGCWSRAPVKRTVAARGPAHGPARPRSVDLAPSVLPLPRRSAR